MQTLQGLTASTESTSRPGTSQTEASAEALTILLYCTVLYLIGRCARLMPHLLSRFHRPLAFGETRPCWAGGGSGGVAHATTAQRCLFDLGCLHARQSPSRLQVCHHARRPQKSLLRPPSRCRVAHKTICRTPSTTPAYPSAICSPATTPLLQLGYPVPPLTPFLLHHDQLLRLLRRLPHQAAD